MRTPICVLSLLACGPTIGGCKCPGRRPGAVGGTSALLCSPPSPLLSVTHTCTCVCVSCRAHSGFSILQSLLNRKQGFVRVIYDSPGPQTGNICPHSHTAQAESWGPPCPAGDRTFWRSTQRPWPGRGFLTPISNTSVLWPPGRIMCPTAGHGDTEGSCSGFTDPLGQGQLDEVPYLPFSPHQLCSDSACTTLPVPICLAFCCSRGGQVQHLSLQGSPTQAVTMWPLQRPGQTSGEK